MNVMAKSLGHRLDSLQTNSPSDLLDAVRLLLSQCNHPFPPSVKTLFSDDSDIAIIVGSLKYLKLLTPFDKVKFIFIVAQERFKKTAYDPTSNFVIPWAALNRNPAVSRETWKPLLEGLLAATSGHISSMKQPVHEWVIHLTLVLLSQVLTHSDPDHRSTLCHVLISENVRCENTEEKQPLGRVLARHVLPTAHSTFFPLGKHLSVSLPAFEEGLNSYLLNICHMYTVLCDTAVDSPISDQIPPINFQDLSKYLASLPRKGKMLFILNDYWDFLHGFLSFIISSSGLALATFKHVFHAFFTMIPLDGMTIRQKNGYDDVWRRLVLKAADPFARDTCLAAFGPLHGSPEGDTLDAFFSGVFKPTTDADNEQLRLLTCKFSWPLILR